MKTFDLETKEGRHEFYKYALEEYKKEEREINSHMDTIPLCPFFDILLQKSNYKEKIPYYDEFTTICKLLPEFFAKKPINVIPRNVWWSSGDNFTLFYKIRIEKLEELVEETK